MPELPEVRTTVKLLNKNVKGKTIDRVLVLLPKLIKNCDQNTFKNNIKGEKINNIKNKGKFIVFELSNNKFIVSHLRMEGKYHTEEWENSKHDYISFIFSDETFLIYNDTRQFGTFHFFSESPYDKKPLLRIAEEPGFIDPKELFEKLKNKKIPIKSSLLDQTLVAGLGNIYVNEVLFDTRINPLTPSNKITLDELRKILISSKEIMDKSTTLGGSSIKSYTSLNKEEGKFQEFLKVHGKKNEKCERCKNLINKIKVGGRGTYYCPKCQNNF